MKYYINLNDGFNYLNYRFFDCFNHYISEFYFFYYMIESFKCELFSSLASRMLYLIIAIVFILMRGTKKFLSQPKRELFYFIDLY